MKNKRFGGKMGEEFELSASAIPHRNKLQKLIGLFIKDKFKEKKINQIKVIEIGFGTGFTTKIIAKSDNRVEVIAIDNELKMLKQAKSNLDFFIKKNKIKLVYEDALVFLKKQNSNSYDVLVSSETLHNFENKYRQKILKEAYRILKRDGLFINADKYALDDENKHKKALDWQLKKFKDKLSPLGKHELIKKWIKHYMEDDKPERIMKESESFKLMKSLGFKNVNIIFRKYMEAVLTAKK